MSERSLCASMGILCRVILCECLNFVCWNALCQLKLTGLCISLHTVKNMGKVLLVNLSVSMYKLGRLDWQITSVSWTFAVVGDPLNYRILIVFHLNIVRPLNILFNHRVRKFIRFLFLFDMLLAPTSQDKFLVLYAQMQVLLQIQGHLTLCIGYLGLPSFRLFSTTVIVSWVLARL